MKNLLAKHLHDEYNLNSYDVTVAKIRKNELKSDDVEIEEVNISLFDMPGEYSLGHCIAQDMRMSAGIAVDFKRIFGRIGELMDQRPNVGTVAYLQHQHNKYIYYLVTKTFSNRNNNKKKFDHYIPVTLDESGMYLYPQYQYPQKATLVHQRSKPTNANSLTRYRVFKWNGRHLVGSTFLCLNLILLY
ncbi:uncharacterized protein LOC126554464 [Aphis gossypii]|uniref:uncharacterized protein LOC126554464 n=1 Tax=Aphis gossypii TaxID=80765 RepID=UPI0021593DB0|nr:uncharacterized protein LOC126554464 [Aphis gossypii]